MASCYKCGRTVMVGVEGPVPVEAVCEKCSSWVHCCANCSFYDEYSSAKCREPKAEFVFDRLGKNACAFFKLKAGAPPAEEKKRFAPRGERNMREGRARDNLAKLFSK